MICFDTRKTAVLLLAFTLASALACGGSAPVRSRTDLINPFLGPEFSGWLIGPIARLATPAEIEAYLAAPDDGAARELIERFWAVRDPNPGEPGNPLRQAFEERAAAADRAYTEAGYLGRRTDRGAVYVLYGRPSKVDYEVPPAPGEPPIEVWFYDEGSPAGLDGRRPLSVYRFTKRDDLTVFYVPGQRVDPRKVRRPGQPGMPPVSPPRP